ncbi:hypothetical protein [Nocardia seriolae]|uniref:hypothetical protein n=1 Tax=Nocardia seriolae TaxID=37332 RepID=UPI0008FF657D|nr:hypothetical protein [Nocardia seriolae]OJF83534.1 hypothetical protein NS14008_36050 [Nocardia seriolae]PSK27284.1 hypothetical protein C6575_32715 [Nocardia seriolae]QOW32325.1 hypothetical protein IMZ23_30740 [Nocardia seriolae]QUN19934.1 hypothetical protein KEC46_11810 [Nocardia seriolae]WNJ59414.1 hypothetical protein RMO66_00685 [Nocardia seriolae]
MADISFPARITVTRQPDADGLPVLNAQLAVPTEMTDLALPPGPAGAPGAKGRPRTTFRKMGAIPTVAARPTGLGADDRGKWWHRLDDDGMDVWDGAQWVHSPHAVGTQGPVAEANTISVVTSAPDPNLTVPAVEFTGKGANQQLKATVPAGLAGARGPAGVSGKIADSPDYDATTNPGPGSVFAYHRATQKFRPLQPPLGTGPWSWYQEDFNADQDADVAQITAGVFTVPAQQFAWRPVVQGHVYVFSATSPVDVTARLNSVDGPILAATRPAAGGYLYLPLLTTYRDEDSVSTLSPSSTFAVVPQGQAANFVVVLNRAGNGSGRIAFARAQASLVIHAQPI